MTDALTPRAIAESLTELWSPRVVAGFDDYLVKVAKVKGTFGWHAHEHEDELFFILMGRLRIELEGSTIELHEGQTFVVPKGVRHNPSADDVCCIMLIERKSTLHSGGEPNPWTRSLDDQLRQH